MGEILGVAIYPHAPITIEEIGRGEEKKAKRTIEGSKELSKYIKEKSPTTIIVITPHGSVFSDAIAISVEENLYGDFRNFGHGDIKYNFVNNISLVKKIIENSNKENIMVAEVDEYLSRNYNVDKKLDHGSLVPLYFVDKEYKDFKLVHITYGILPPKDLYKFGRAIKNAVLESEDNIILLASGDLSHKLKDDGPYNYSPYGPEFDEKIVNIIGEGKLEEILTFDLNLAEKAGECGLRSFMVMTGVIDGYDFKPEVLSYEGPYGVGYCTAKIDIVGKINEGNLLEIVDKEEKLKIKSIRDKESPYVKLARESLEYYIREGKYLKIDSNIPKELLDTKKAVFVTLYKDGVLRGCIGTTEPRYDNIALEIIKNAVSAGLEDPRFDEVEEDELNSIVYSVDILSEPETIESKEELDVKNYGIIVTSGYKKGLLLPNLDGIDTVEEQIDIALKKANIHYGENYTMERFKVIRHH